MASRLKINGRSMTAVAALEAALQSLQEIWPYPATPFSTKRTMTNFNPLWIVYDLYGRTLKDKPKLNSRLVLPNDYRDFIEISQNLREMVESKSTRANEVDDYMDYLNVPQMRLGSYYRRQDEYMNNIYRASQGYYRDVVQDAMRFAKKMYKPFEAEMNAEIYEDFSKFARTADEIYVKYPDWMFALPKYSRIEIGKGSLVNYLWQIGFVKVGDRSDIRFLVDNIPRAIHRDIEDIERQIGRTVYGVTRDQVENMWASRNVIV